jgi:hypothetical protein
MSDDAMSHTVTWEPSIESLLAKWCDEAKCFEWMHNEAFADYDKYAKRLIITSNIVAAVAGLSNIIAGDQIINGFQLSWAFGSLTIVISILNMIQEKMAYASMAIKFRQYSITWSIIRRKIEGELALPPQSRKDCGTFLQSIRQDINQVSLAGNAHIPEGIRAACYKKFITTPDFEIPEICGDMEHTAIYKPPEGSLTQHLLPIP